MFKKKQKTVTTSIATATKSTSDTTKKTPVSKLNPYDQVITKNTKSAYGLINFHRVQDKYFFEIPNSLLETDLLVVNRISKGASGTSQANSGYSGDQINENVVRFSKGPNDKLYIKSVSYTERSTDSTDNGMYRSVRNSGLQPIVAAFDIKALSKDSTAVVIDVTDYLNGDNEVLFFNSGAKSGLKLGGLQADKSYISSGKAFPQSLEIKTVKTYSKAAGPASPGIPPTGIGNATYELNSSIIRLPQNPMLPRFYDDRIGYFSTGYIDFDRNSQGVAQTTMITRWRLEPKKEDEAKYLKGELVEPTRQIIFYIDPTTPKKWVPYLIQGVNDWNIAFEAAGFKNAIVAKEAPTNAQDSTWSIESARYNVIVYKPSAISNASGPHVHDPRTGEILETHINWYHNVMQLLRNWYFIQAAAVDPKARKMKFDDELMGQLIRFVSSHEVGHTLGLTHNFGSSSTVPVEKLRDKAWVEANGHTPSIMDYARFNYVAQPEDGISEKGIFPRIGIYDKWAIEWGYRWFPTFNSREEEKSHMNNWIVKQLKMDKRYWYGEQSINVSDPRRQSEDLGDNAMKAGYYGIKNLKRIVPNLIQWTNEANEGYKNLDIMYKEVVAQYKRYISHVVNNIGLLSWNKQPVEENGDLLEFTPKNKQREAVRFLQDQLFETPKWLMDAKIFKKVGGQGPNLPLALQVPALNQLLSPDNYLRLVIYKDAQPENAYEFHQLLNDLMQGIWKELPNQLPIDYYRRNLQKVYAERLIELLDLSKSADPMEKIQGPYFNYRSDMSPIVRSHMKTLLHKINSALPLYKDKLSREHLLQVKSRLQNTLNPNAVIISGNVNERSPSAGFALSNIDSITRECCGHHGLGNSKFQSCW
ncbi:zinc-dependent metalloprotease [Pedobacter heparinus]|uniref:zinc-dependent metalloprotease n=1 Tax=Pedobacter heparinus TaxID=984 RepID=UPI00138AE9A1|nr:zinc-dependent metalloprotease [Pedobacter heparinus]